MKGFVFTAVVALTLGLTGCSGGDPGDPAALKDGKSNLHAVSPALFAATAATLTITDIDGHAVVGAKVLIGSRENVPFPANLLTTDSAGQISIPTEWVDAQPVTISAKGFVRATYFATLPNTASLTVRKAVQNGRFELKGDAKGFGELKKDGFADVGLIFPAVPRSAIATLNVANLISPEADVISVYGQKMSIPSNVTFPEQTENYVLPIKLNKPQYRSYLNSTGTHKFVALHARMPFKSTVDDMRGGKNFLDMINTFEFRQGAIRDVVIAQPAQTLDINVDGGVFARTLPFIAPRFDVKYALLAVALGESGGLFYPTDIKNVAAGATINLSTPVKGAGQGVVVAAIREKNAPTETAASEFMSAVLLPSNSSRAYDFLPMIAAPQFKNQILNLDEPRAPASVTPVMTYATLNRVELIVSGEVRVERKTPQWDVYAPAWQAQLQLPLIPAVRVQTDNMRWEVTYGGVFNGQPTPAVGPQALEQFSHITRSALDF